MARCLICNESVAVSKTHNLRQNYATKQLLKYSKVYEEVMHRKIFNLIDENFYIQYIYSILWCRRDLFTQQFAENEFAILVRPAATNFAVIGPSEKKV